MRSVVLIFFCWASVTMAGGVPHKFDILIEDIGSRLDMDGLKGDMAYLASFRLTGHFDGQFVRDLRMLPVSGYSFSYDDDDYPVVEGEHLNRYFKFVRDSNGAVWVKKIHVSGQFLADLMTVDRIGGPGFIVKGASWSVSLADPFDLEFPIKGVGKFVMVTTTREVKFRTYDVYPYTSSPYRSSVTRKYSLRYKQSQATTYPFPPEDD